MKYKVRFKNRWRQYKPGDEAEFDLGVADALVRSFKADWVQDDAGDATDGEKAMDGPPADKAMSGRKSRRKAKRKG